MIRVKGLRWPAILGFVLFEISVAFETGAPDNTCRDPSSVHTFQFNATHTGIYMPQPEGRNPYILQTDRQTFGPGQPVKVTIHSGNTGQPFRGFFIQVVEANINIRNLSRIPFGTFAAGNGSRPSSCDMIGEAIHRGGVTHLQNDDKYNITVTWIPPVENPGNVQFLNPDAKRMDPGHGMVCLDDVPSTGTANCATRTTTATATRKHGATLGTQFEWDTS